MSTSVISPAVLGFLIADLEVDGKGPLVIRECVRSIDGELLLESITGRGSRLVITIPRKWQSPLLDIKGTHPVHSQKRTLMPSTKTFKIRKLNLL